jgi:hypothetical protein
MLEVDSVAPFIDASVFLGLHHREIGIRQRSLGLFRSMFAARVQMNFEQIGICDAVIWRQRREVQDLYYPFMDRLHSEMQIVRAGYAIDELDLAVGHRELRGLKPEQALLAAQVLTREAVLASHDPMLRGLRCLKSRLWDFEAPRARGGFPPELESLYQISRVFVHGAAE